MWAAVKKGWSNGGLLIGIGGIAAMGSGAALYQMEAEDSMKKKFNDAMHDSRAAEDRKFATVGGAASSNALTKDPILFEAKVTHALGMLFDGPVALRNLKEGETVSVLEEKVGPDERYCRARSYREGKPISEGWYPSQFLAKVEPAITTL
jgi:hypothetical protein